MSTRETHDGPLEDIWKFFASVRLTIVLLLSLAAASIIGTLIPQNESPQGYVQAFGDFGYRLFDVLGLLDLYHAWWYQAMMLLLVVNILVCSIERLSATWKIIFPGRPKFNLDRFRRLDPKEEFQKNSPAEKLKDRYQTIIGRNFSHCRVEDTEEGYAIFGE